MFAKLYFIDVEDPWWVTASFWGAVAVSLAVGVFLILRDRRRTRARGRGEQG